MSATTFWVVELNTSPKNQRDQIQIKILNNWKVNRTDKQSIPRLPSTQKNHEIKFTQMMQNTPYNYTTPKSQTPVNRQKNTKLSTNQQYPDVKITQNKSNWHIRTWQHVFDLKRARPSWRNWANWRNWKAPPSPITKLEQKSRTIAVNNRHGSGHLQVGLCKSLR